MASTKSPILIVGAGPTGLLCSIWLTRYGVPHMIIDKLPAPGLASRAMGVHARTLEIYRSLGLASSIIDLGHAFQSYSFFYHGDLLFEVPIGHAGVGLSPYPIVLSVTQDEHEEVLEKHLNSLGTTVERQVELLSITQPPNEKPTEDIKVRVLDRDGVEEEIRASYVVGCDGARSGVRQEVEIEMQGGTYPNDFYVADVICSGDMPTAGRMNLFVTKDEYACFLPLPHREGRARIIGLVPTILGGKKDLCFDDLRPKIKIAAPALEIDEVQWFATYKVHHRCAAKFQLAHRIFLCGDAAHLHSPVGAQGMNTGLGDASNLAWKLATAWHSSSAYSKDLDAGALLASYEMERRPFARDLVNTTDTFFKYFTDDGLRGYIVRNFIIYYILPLITRLVNVGRHMYKLESQIAVTYPISSLSQCVGTKSVLSGMRLPWVNKVTELSTSTPAKAPLLDDTLQDDNHAVLDAAGWQVHVYSSDENSTVEHRRWLEKIQASAERDHVAMKVFLFDEAARAAGYVQDTLYLVRPDGYIGLTVAQGTPDADLVMEDYLTRFGARWLARHGGSTT